VRNFGDAPRIPVLQNSGCVPEIPPDSSFYTAPASLLVVKGFSLIEVVVVMALIALTLTLAGPRIRAGFGRLELEQSAQAIRSFVKAGRVQAQRADREYHVVIDRKRDSMALLDAELKVVRKESLPSSVQIILDSDAPVSELTISPSGIVRGEPIRLRGRTGELKITLQ